MKNVRKFEDFINEEISDEYIDKGVAKAKEAGRTVSEPYSNVLKKKNIESKKDRTLAGMRSLITELNETFKDIVDAKVQSMDVFVIIFKGQNYQLTYIGNEDKLIFFVQGNQNKMSKALETIGSLSDSTKKVTFFNYLSSLFKKYIPESKYADRRVWSTLESNVVRFEDFETVNEEVSELEKLENELEKEVTWVRKYSKHVDKGSYPKDDYDDEDEFYADLEKTEANIERLNKLIRNKKK